MSWSFCHTPLQTSNEKGFPVPNDRPGMSWQRPWAKPNTDNHVLYCMGWALIIWKQLNSHINAPITGTQTMRGKNLAVRAKRNPDKGKDAASAGREQLCKACKLLCFSCHALLHSHIALTHSSHINLSNSKHGFAPRPAGLLRDLLTCWYMTSVLLGTTGAKRDHLKI